MREKLPYKHHGLTVYKTEDGEFAIGSDAKCDRAARRAVVDVLWAFNTSCIVRFLRSNNKAFVGMSDTAAGEFEQALQKMQETLCEDAQPIIRAMLGTKLNKFVQEAIAADGRGHFLSPYDSEESRSEDYGFKPGRLVYKLNN
jgi:hypothetical protein